MRLLRYVIALFKRATIFQVFAALLLALVGVRMAYPTLNFDKLSLLMLGLAFAVLITPRVLANLPPLRKLKVMEFEAEFQEKVERALDALEKDVERSEEQISAEPLLEGGKSTQPRRGYPPLFPEYLKEYGAILTSRASNLEKIVAASTLVERMIMEAARELGVLQPGSRLTPQAVVAQLYSEGFLTEAERSAFDELWQIRNLVVHGSAGKTITDSQTARVLDLLSRLARTFG